MMESALNPISQDKEKKSSRRDRSPFTVAALPKMVMAGLPALQGQGQTAPFASASNVVVESNNSSYHSTASDANSPDRTSNGSSSSSSLPPPPIWASRRSSQTATVTPIVRVQYAKDYSIKRPSPTRQADDG
uniref:Uncharacterized protein n=1 Tax=Plectus sambesii TaxID=2011161 RepID=A0A914VZ11_9BILA